ncbi:SusC/RagA family TonB-linked outer membrane protein [Membranihabitans marinus]|uniref:SusC/RagA family TonB-linked outer membrane protein n=1 Tax=Membranihabitans marinus TaxID=1227546 RepID=UPI001F2C31E7|nr:TonB-dependent receptor [Membranihabitans marinus]
MKIIFTKDSLIYVIMRFSAQQLILLLFFSGLAFAGVSDAQILDRKVSVEWESIRLDQALRSLELQTDVHFVYSVNAVEMDKEVVFQAADESLGQVLQSILKPIGIQYVVKDENYIVLKRETIQRVETLPNKMDYFGLKQLKISALTVSGLVTDSEGQPLIGVNVLEKGTDNGGASDFNGRFSLEEVSEQAVLVFSYIGYQTQEIVLAGKTVLNVTMLEDAQTLDELVVVGYGTQKRVNLTGAVDVISNEQIQDRQANTVSQILQGQSPGLNFSPGINGFEPGASLDINIRGMGSLNGGSPFILIDGVPGNMDLINPEDIESISVLKDAAASAIYGARAPYGVILITTKSGKKNEKISVTYSGNVFLNTASRLPEMLDSYTHARIVNEAGENSTGGRSFTDDIIDRMIAFQNNDVDYLRQFTTPDATNFETYPLANGTWSGYDQAYGNYDWYDEHYGSSINQQHNISIKGGSEKTSYYLSAGILDQEGIMNYGVDYYRRYNIMAKINTKLTDWWDVSYNTRFIKSPREAFNAGATNGYSLQFRQIARTFPSEAKYDGNGNYAQGSNIPGILDRGSDKKTTTENWQTIATEIRPLKNWRINADFSYSSRVNEFSDRILSSRIHQVDKSVVLTPPQFTKITQTLTNNAYWASNVYTSYDWNINSNHNIYALVGMQYELNNYHNLNSARSHLTNLDVPSLNTAIGDVVAKEAITHSSTQGYFTRLTYNFQEKYLVEANARYDGTSRFKEGKRWGFFPSFSVGWNLDKEAFWTPIQKHVNAFKLRASWGQLGNQQVSPYQDIALIPYQADKLDWLFSYGGTRKIGFTGTPSIVSPSLTWETATTKNIGINASFFDHRLQTDFDLFERNTENMIGPSEPAPNVLGASVPRSNNANLRSRGWELSLKWNQVVQGKDLSWFVGVNIYDVKTIVTEYLNPNNLITTWYPGKEVGEIWGYTANELFRDQADVDSYLEKVDMGYIFNNWYPGDLKYLDTNGDGAVNKGANTLDDPGDQKIIGSETPRYQYGITAGMNYKGFDFSILMKGTGKRDFFFPEGGNNIRYWGLDWLPFTTITPDHLDYYRDRPGDKYTGLYEGDANINLDAFWPRTYIVNGHNDKNRKPATRYLADASYLRIQNMQIGYNLPASLLQKYNISKVRVYVSGENLATFTDLIKGIDPVALVGYAGGAGQTYGADRVFSMGLTITL